MRKYYISYAQEEEDIILQHVLKDVEKVFWVDVGANDPIDISVTHFFYKRGGNGINIEPLIQYKDKYERIRKRDTNLFVGVAKTEGIMRLYGEGVNASFESEGQNTNEYIEVPVRRLDNICEQYVAEKQNIHFLKIDVELYEEDVLLSANFKKYRPWIVVVESISHNKETYEDWEYVLLQNGYNFAYKDLVGLNRYYIANERAYLKERFKELDCIQKLYSVEKYYLISKNKEDNEGAFFRLGHNIVVFEFKRYCNILCYILKNIFKVK